MSKTMFCPSCGKTISHYRWFCSYCKTYIIKEYLCHLRILEPKLRRLNPMQRQIALLWVWFYGLLREPSMPGSPAWALVETPVRGKYRASLTTTTEDEEYLVVDILDGSLYVGRIKEGDEIICYEVPSDVRDDVLVRLRHDSCLPGQVWAALDEAMVKKPGKHIETLMNPKK